MCCWNTNKLLVEHRYETGQDVIYQDRQALVVQVYPVEVGKADYDVFVDGKTIRVCEDALTPVEVDAYALVNR